MAKYKVVVSDWEFEDLSYEKAILDNEEIELVSVQCITEQDVIAHCHDADAIINSYAPINQRVIKELKKCKVISRYGVGVNNIDLEAATEKGICVANVPDYCIDEVSDHALALLLSWARKIPFADKATKEKDWDYKLSGPIYRLKGRILGLIGFGKISQRLAEKAAPLGLKVIAYDPYFPKEVALEKGVELVSLDEICSKSDIISVHVPLTNETNGIIGKKQLESMKKETFIINTSRGPAIDEEALIHALETDQIAGAALDVTEEEPIRRDHPFLSMDHIIVTPHVAWYSEEAEREVRSKVAMAVADVLLHQQYPKYLVNNKLKDSFKIDA